MTTTTLPEPAHCLRVLCAPARSSEIAVSGQRDELIGRSDGHDIVQIGAHAYGTPIRWRFTEISPDSFLWTGEALQSDGKTWKLQGQFRARRLAITSFEKGQSL